MIRTSKINVAAAALVALASGGLVACSDDAPAAMTADAATPGPDVGATSPDGGTSSTDSGTLALYQRLGGQAGLEAFVKGVVDNHILTDADLKTFFFNQVASPIPAGHPSAKQIEVCFARLVGTALGSDTYPGTPVTDATNTNTPNFTCRSMVESHKGATTMLHIGSGTFDKFIGYVAMDLMPLVKPVATKAGEITQAEFGALAAALNGQKTDVTTADASATAGPFPN
jgi:hypothetical protein